MLDFTIVVPACIMSKFTNEFISFSSLSAMGKVGVPFIALLQIMKGLGGQDISGFITRIQTPKKYLLELEMFSFRTIVFTSGIFA